MEESIDSPAGVLALKTGRVTTESERTNQEDRVKVINDDYGGGGLELTEIEDLTDSGISVCTL